MVRRHTGQDLSRLGEVRPEYREKAGPVCRSAPQPRDFPLASTNAIWYRPALSALSPPHFRLIEGFVA